MFITACMTPAISPVVQMDKLSQQQNQQINEPGSPKKVIKSRHSDEYLCDHQQILKLQYDDSNKKAVDVTFQQTTHTLYSAVPKKNKKYSNIRWIWSEDFNGKGTLRDNSNKVLAKECIKK